MDNYSKNILLKIQKNKQNNEKNNDLICYYVQKDMKKIEELK